MRIDIVVCFFAITSVSGIDNQWLLKSAQYTNYRKQLQRIYGMEKQSSIGKYNFAAYREFTYQVSLMLRDSIKDNIFYHVCGGAIISKSHILTAAHCVFDINPPNENYMVLTGSNDLNDGGQLRTIMKILIHPKYYHEMTNSFRGNDIATLTVHPNIIFDSYHSSINFAKRDIPNDSQGIITGWDVSSVKGPNISISTMQKFYATVYNLKECQKNIPVRLYRDQICAKAQLNGKGSCLSDSGSPLVVRGELVGIASIIYSCAYGLPDIYTNVCKHKDFILESMDITSIMNVKRGELPYVVSLRNSRRQHFCGGSIIGPKQILTAAHCFDLEINIQDVTVRSGTTRLSGGTVHRVRKVNIHSKFVNSGRFRHDIAVITLRNSIKINEYQFPIKIAKRRNRSYEGRQATIAGWEQILDGKHFVIKRLQKLIVTVRNISDCLSLVEPGLFRKRNTICTFEQRGSKACISDGGAGLVVDGELIGVAGPNYGERCSTTNRTPDFYTEVSPYRRLIGNSKIME